MEIAYIRDHFQYIPEDGQMRAWAGAALTGAAPAFESVEDTELKSQALKELASLETLCDIAHEVNRRIEDATRALLQTRAILSPIRRVPDEIIGCIMSSLPTDWPHPEDIFNARLVCRRWNRVFKNTCGIWSDITLDLRDRWGMFKNLGRITQAWLDIFAHSCPLDVTIQIDNDRDCEHHFFHAFLCLIQQSARWRSLEYSVSGGIPEYFVKLLELNTSLSNLRRLRYDSGVGSVPYPSWSEAEKSDNEDHFNRAKPLDLPALRELDIRTASFRRFPKFAAPSLTRLNLQNVIIRPHDYSTFSEGTPNVEILTFEAVKWWFAGERDLPTSHGHQRVTQLTWIVIGYENADTFDAWALRFAPIRFLEILISQMPRISCLSTSWEESTRWIHDESFHHSPWSQALLHSLEVKFESEVRKIDMKVFIKWLSQFTNLDNLTFTTCLQPGYHGDPDPEVTAVLRAVFAGKYPIRYYDDDHSPPMDHPSPPPIKHLILRDAVVDIDLMLESEHTFMPPNLRYSFYDMQHVEYDEEGHALEDTLPMPDMTNATPVEVLGALGYHICSACLEQGEENCC